MCEKLGVEAVDFCHLFDEIGVATVVGEGVVRVGDFDLGVGTDAAFAADHHGADAGEVGLEGDGLEVEHQLDVVGKDEGDAGGFIEVGELAGVLFHGVHALFEVADGGEVFVHLAAVGGAEIGFEAAGVVAGEVEHAAAIEGSSLALFGS